MRHPLLATAATALLMAGALAPAEARSARNTARTEITPAEEREFPFDADIPGCQAPAVLERVSSQFAEKESQFWNSSLTVVAYDSIQRTAWRPWGLDAIPRRFCSAVATTSDGVRRKVDYSVRESTGFIGASWGVEFCIQGTDRNWAYNPSCLAARP